MAAKKRIGRPPKAKEDRKAVNFTFRSRGQMRERLQAAAITAGRSISEEIEFRLERSFQQQEIEKALERLKAQTDEILLEWRKERQQWRDEMRRVMGVTEEALTQQANQPGLLDLADSPADTSKQTATEKREDPKSLEVRALSDDELAKRIAEAKAAEQMGQAHKQPKPPDFKVPSPHEDTSEQPATDKREDSK